MNNLISPWLDPAAVEASAQAADQRKTERPTPAELRRNNLLTWIGIGLVSAAALTGYAATGDSTVQDFLERKMDVAARQSAPTLEESVERIEVVYGPQGELSPTVAPATNYQNSGLNARGEIVIIPPDATTVPRP